MSSDDIASAGTDSGVLLKVKLVTESVPGDQEMEVAAKIMSEISYEDWEVDIENEDYARGLCKLSKNT